MQGKYDMLFKLVRSLTSNEKRYFTIYAARHTIGGQNNSLRLFKKLSALKVKKTLISLDEMLVEQRNNLSQDGLLIILLTAD